MIRPPDFAELEAFVAAVDERSIARAARKLRISAPAAAKRIRQLEALAGREVLTRGARGVEPTATGHRLYPVARDLLADRERAVQALTGEGPSDRLRIPGMQSVLGTLDPRAPIDALHQTESLLAAVFHAASDPLVITRAEDGLICEINDAAANLTGYEQDELRWRRVAEVKLWRDLEARETLVKQAISGGEPMEGNLILVTKSRGELPVRGRFEAIKLHSVVYVLLVLHVLTS